jgi:hypothetical protein
VPDESSPNDQTHDVGEFDDVSVNWTVRGTVPYLTSAVNDATGELMVLTVI